MILCIGEILADMVGEKHGDEMSIKAFAGGAPFNVAVNAKQSGAKVGFIGRVGKDAIGKYVKEFAKKVGLDYLDIQEDKERNTTLAFVTLNEGERDFTFFRHDTADFNIDGKNVDLSKFDDVNIVHIGSLMLSEEKGRLFATDAVQKIRNANKLFSFDVNFRMDLFGNLTEAVKAYQPFVDEADVLKFSDDEILAYTGKSTVSEAIGVVCRENRLLLVTLGGRGSVYAYNGIVGSVPTKKIKPVDTTGAGDTFFGTVLAALDGKKFNKDNIEAALYKGSEAGAAATQFVGAIRI